MFYVYAYLRSSDLTPYYIGKGQGNRAWTKDHAVVVPNDLKRIVILESNLSEIGALALERRMIEWYGRKDLLTGILRNKTDGGDGASGIIPWNKGKEIGSFLTEQGRKKIVKANSKPKNHGAKVSAASKGKPKSEEHRAKLSESGKGKTPWNKGLTKENNNSVQQYSLLLKGRTFSEEHRAKLSESHKGRSNTEEQKAKISAKLKGRVMSEETKKKMSDARKKLWEQKRNEKR